MLPFLWVCLSWDYSFLWLKLLDWFVLSRFPCLVGCYDWLLLNKSSLLTVAVPVGKVVPSCKLISFIKSKKIKRTYTKIWCKSLIYNNLNGGDGGSWTRVRPYYAYDSTCLESVYGFNPHRTDSQDGLDDLLRVRTCHRNANKCYPLCVRFGVSNQTKGNLCRPK